jgi:enediyne biosynthesis protein E4
MEIMGSGGLFLDYDEDGWIDIFLVDGGSLVDPRVDATARDRLYRNRGDGTFQDISASSGIVHAGYGMGACAADYDNDGWTDLYVTSVGPNRLHHNDGGAIQRRDGARGSRREPCFQHELRVRRCRSRLRPRSLRDQLRGVDNDGDPDLLVTNNAGLADLLRNGGTSGRNSLLVRLAGTRSNRSAVGARLRLTAGGRTQVREVKAGSSHLGQHDLRVHFGLGQSMAIERLEVRWPNGQMEMVTGAGVNQMVTITEGKGVTESKAMKR